MAQTCDFRKFIEPLLMLTLSLQSLVQNQSLEIIQACTVVLCFPRNNIVGTHFCDECTGSNAPSVCRKLLSILCQHKQVCSQTIKDRVYHSSQVWTFQKTICEQTVDSSPTDPISSSLLHIFHPDTNARSKLVNPRTHLHYPSQQRWLPRDRGMRQPPRRASRGAPTCSHPHG